MPYIAISYRDEGVGKGAFFDHFTVRKMTGWLTQIAIEHPKHPLVFSSYINGRAGLGAYGLPLSTDLPLIAGDDARNAAFIYLPGFTRESDTNNSTFHQARLSFEKELIRKAIYRGQPVLAVCAGSWTLWQAYGGELVDVADHNYGGAMPRLSKITASVCNNKMIHRVRPENNTFLASAMGNHHDVAVNSVHWKAVNAASVGLSRNIQISAKSVKDDGLAPNSRQGHHMQPEECSEAFETICGVPMVGVQWHPEAFNPEEEDAEPHQGIFKSIKIAGQTYLNRQNLNKEFNRYWLTHAHDSMSFFKPKIDKYCDEVEEELSRPSVNEAFEEQQNCQPT